MRTFQLSLFRTQSVLCHLSSQATWRQANAATGLLRNSNADVATYFCCLVVRINRRILFRSFAIVAYVSSHIFFAIYTALLSTNVC